MLRRYAIGILLAAVLAGAVVQGLATRSPRHPVPPAQPVLARGVVFLDANANGRRDPGERGLAGVRVSDQTNIVKTNRDGRWEMPAEADNDTIYFVIKPRGYKTPVSEYQLPRFYYIHKPAGSPPSKFPGVAPTGPLPVSIDFPLTPSREPDKFEALFFGDTQPRDVREVDYIRKDIVEPLVGRHGARFGITLGDIVFDDLNVFEPMIKTVALLGVPWYNVLGNHDINMDAPDDERSDETFERTFGPNYYSFDHGPVHFIVLDNVEWTRTAERGSYRGAFGKKQLDWLQKDLDLVPKDQLIVLTMHIPVVGTLDQQALYRLIEDRPYTLSVSAHTHYQEHFHLKAENGWKGKTPHHHVVNVTTSGSWWSGAPDEQGIPHTTMRDGAPNGYAVFSFDGKQYKIAFRAARRPESYQMDIHAPDTVAQAEAAGTEILVNVFGGSEKSKVEMRVGESEWTALAQVRSKDPAYEAVFERDKGLQRPFRALPAPIDSPHMWAGKLPRGLPKGMHPIHVRTTDMFGQTFLATKGIEVK
jgi:3',5'-cyclic AMP phosphodiesterase CpdA